MNKWIIATFLYTMAAAPIAHANLTTPISAVNINVESNLVWLDSSDTMRTFGDSCATGDLTNDARQASQEWLKQGFVQIAKIKLPAEDETGMGLPECAYLFVRSTQLR